MIPSHRYGSVLLTLDRAIGRHFARVDDICSEIDAADTTVFFEQSVKWLCTRLTKDLDPWRSRGLWRLDLSRKTPASGKLLTNDIRGRFSGFYCEIPAASGVVDWQEGARRFDNRHANVDLVQEIVAGQEYIFIELKKDSETPHAAAAKLVRYSLLYLLARWHAPRIARGSNPLLNATRVGLAVWAPSRFYDGYDGARLERVVSEALKQISAGLMADFRFRQMDEATGATTAVDWAGAVARAPRPVRHVAGPFRSLIKHKLQAAPSPLLFNASWESLLEGRRHGGLGQPDSSQAFGLNLFAPLKNDPDLARAVLDKLLPGFVCASDQISISFEQNSDRGALLLNERGVRTQIDVLFELSGPDGNRSVLVEVKFAEERFGSCRGWLTRNRERCCRVLAAPEDNCYLATKFNREYWKYLQPLLRPTPTNEPCPFRGSLYQLMRNYLTARLHAPNECSRFAICCHPGNDEFRILDLHVAGEEDAIVAFRALLGDEAVSVWNARDLVDYARAARPSLGEWYDWMAKYYFDGTLLPRSIG